MPEDYQAILSDLGISDPAPAADPAPADPAPAQDPEPTPASNDEGANGAQDDNSSNTDNNAQQNNTDSDAQKRSNEAFAAMRAEVAKYKKFVGQIMKGAGFDGKEDDFMSNLVEASYAQQAKRQGNQVSPEILKRMDTLENQNRSLLDAQNRQIFAANVKNMQSTLGLTDKDVTEFINLAAKEQIDLTYPGTNFIALYQGLFFNKLLDRKVEAERQKWIAQNSKAGNAANPDGKSGKKDPTPTDINTMAEFDSLLQQSFPKK